MQRITRLLSGPPSRGRWGARAALGILLTAGVLLVSQVIAGHSLPDLHITSTTDGVLGPGDSREITANGLDKQRFYRASVDAQGRLTEVYEEDGVVRPIDSGVRTWLAEVSRMTVPPPPPPPPVAPPMPPMPPPPPNIADATEFKALVRVVAADPRVIAKLGTPVVAMTDRVRGNIRIDKADGDADLRFDLSGPKGRAEVQVEAELEHGAWTLETLDLQ